MDARGAVAVWGAGGRVGRELLSALAAHPTLRLGLAVGRAQDPRDPALRAALAGCVGVVDFSLPEAQPALLSALDALAAEGRALPLVTGVTGLDAAGWGALEARARRAPTLHAANFSLGVALLARLTAQASRALGPSFDVEVFELHHRQKRDAPSGTALHLARAAAEGRGGSVSDAPTPLPRDPALVHVSAGRGGQEVGEHTVFFLGEAERLELTHRAASRAVFAHGALRALDWLRARPAGALWGLGDLLDDLLGGAAGAPRGP
ncbi:MAG: 4-hydroxy-tetrahydrodipicolinate reductase [Deltaproteobacteria bacterium]|nr:4-hydroxy-tetrahydrodipicolinate reductase [Deltaproteobacteria bacterium]